MRFFAALRMTGRGMRPAGDAGGESHHRLRAVPLPLTREAKGGTGGAEPRPYGSTLVREKSGGRFVNRPYASYLSRRGLSRGKHAVAPLKSPRGCAAIKALRRAQAIENPTTA